MKKVKYLIFLILLFGVIFSYKNVDALTVSQYKTRNNCNSKFELAGAHSDGSAAYVGC